MTADNEMDMKETFQRAQKGHNNKAKLVASLKSRYDKVHIGKKPQNILLYLFIVWTNSLTVSHMRCHRYVKVEDRMFLFLSFKLYCFKNIRKSACWEFVVDG